MNIRIFCHRIETRAGLLRIYIMVSHNQNCGKQEFQFADKRQQTASLQ